MRKLKFFMAAVAAAGLVACGGGGGDDDGPAVTPPQLVQDAPGKIAGLGLTAGPVAGKPYTLPTGVKTTDMWLGMFMVPSTTPSTAGVQIAQGDAVQKIIGSGYAVAVRIPLENTTDREIEVEFPRGLVVVNLNGQNQNGVLLAAATTKVPAKSTVTIALVMYCGNETLPGSLRNTPYQSSSAVVAASSTLNDFTALLKDKKIGAELYGADGKGYSDIAGEMQALLHKLTDKGEALTPADVAWIKGLPNN